MLILNDVHVESDTAIFYGRFSLKQPFKSSREAYKQADITATTATHMSQ